ncbi:hypothetical protein [Kordia sp.]|uniref:hypothetical protein n=1 Tax=Kordia sp. TaxID=1965332 RepID=UPI0025BC4C0E|nr:hypothetical protein [Kordia sp.]MCH2195120.1 hypothetical protein [Kordia sp.]
MNENKYRYYIIQGQPEVALGFPRTLFISLSGGHSKNERVTVIVSVAEAANPP